MNILSINNIQFTPNYQKQKFLVSKDNFGLTMAKPLLNDTVSFKATLKDTAKVAVTNELKHKGNVFLDILTSIVNKHADRGVSMNLDYCKLNLIKSGDACLDKMSRRGDSDVKDRIRATIFSKDIENMELLNDILRTFDEEKGFILSKDHISIEKAKEKGYIPKKGDKDIVEIPDLDIRLNNCENLSKLPNHLKCCVGKPQKSGYEDIQMRLVNKYDLESLKYELIILMGEQYAIAKHREYENVYKIVRKLDKLGISKLDDSNEQVRKIKRCIDLIKHLCSVEISQKLFENAKNKDVYNIDNIIEIKITEKDVQTLENFFDEMVKNVELYHSNLKKSVSGDKKTLYNIEHESKMTIQEIQSIRQELINSVKQVNKGKYPKTLDELINKINKSKKITKNLS